MRPDLAIVARMIPRECRVLDLGCGDGALLEHLIVDKACAGQGVEVSEEAFHACVARGIPVVAADIDRGLPDFADGSFDVVVLSQTLQSTRRPLVVLREMMRVGGLGIVSFHNFGHWRLRLRLALRGRVPAARALPHPWYETPAIRPCTISDFEDLVSGEAALRVAQRRLLDARGRAARPAVHRRPNLLAAGAIYAVTV
jgi:methionine biosynthesis protein MetW